jgi:adenosylcobinamide-GDP ribazoletransferase
MRSLKLALQFLTILPLRVDGEVPPAALRRSLAWFPVVGLLIGAVLATLQQHLWSGVPAHLSCLLLVAAGLLITGALHLDGLADVADALCARKDREGRLAVMKDPRVGAAGAAAVVLAILLRWELLVSLGGPVQLLALLVSPLVGRAAMVVALRVLPPARPDGLARLMGPAPWGAVLSSLGLAVVFPMGVLGILPGLQALAGAALAVGILLSVSSRAFGGITGDVCGAAGELAELACLAGFLRAGA